MYRWFWIILSEITYRHWSHVKDFEYDQVFVQKNIFLHFFIPEFMQSYDDWHKHHWTGVFLLDFHYHFVSGISSRLEICLETQENYSHRGSSSGCWFRHSYGGTDFMPCQSKLPKIISRCLLQWGGKALLRLLRRSFRGQQPFQRLDLLM